MFHEELGTPLPRQVQVFDEEARHDHAHAVVHPPGGEHLAHARIDDWIPRLARTPRGEALLGAVVGVDGHRLHLQLQVLPRGARLVVQHVGVELAPPKFAAVVVVVLVGAQLGEQLARVQHTEAQIRRKHAAAVAVGVVAFFFVATQCVAGELLPPRPGGFFATGGQRGATLGLLRYAVALHVGGSAQVHVGWSRQRLLPAMSNPPARKRGEHRKRRAVVLAHHARVDCIWRADALEPHALHGETLGDLVVARGTVRAEVFADEHGVGADFFGKARHDVERVAVAHHDGAIHRGVECANVAIQEAESCRTRALHEERVEHEEWCGHPVRESSGERGMISES